MPCQVCIIAMWGRVSYHNKAPADLPLTRLRSPYLSALTPTLKLNLYRDFGPDPVRDLVCDLEV